MDTNKEIPEEEELPREMFPCLPLSSRLSSLSDHVAFDSNFVGDVTPTLNNRTSPNSELNTSDTTDPPSTAAYVNGELVYNEDDSSDKSLPPPPSDEFLRNLNNGLVLNQETKSDVDLEMTVNCATSCGNISPPPELSPITTPQSFTIDNTRCIPPSTPRTSPADTRLPTPIASQHSIDIDDPIVVNIEIQPELINQLKSGTNGYPKQTNRSIGDESNPINFSQELQSRLSAETHDINIETKKPNLDCQRDSNALQSEKLDSSPTPTHYENISYDLKPEASSLDPSFYEFDDDLSEEYDEVNYDEETLSNLWYSTRSENQSLGFDRMDTPPIVCDMSNGGQLSTVTSVIDEDTTSGSDLSESFIRQILDFGCQADYGEHDISFENIAYSESDDFGDELGGMSFDENISSQTEVSIDENKHENSEIEMGGDSNLSSTSTHSIHQLKLVEHRQAKQTGSSNGLENPVRDDCSLTNTQCGQVANISNTPMTKYDCETIAADKRFYKLVKDDDDSNNSTTYSLDTDTSRFSTSLFSRLQEDDRILKLLNIDFNNSAPVSLSPSSFEIRPTMSDTRIAMANIHERLVTIQKKASAIQSLDNTIPPQKVKSEAINAPDGLYASDDNKFARNNNKRCSYINIYDDLYLDSDSVSEVSVPMSDISSSSETSSISALSKSTVPPLETLVDSTVQESHSPLPLGGDLQIAETTLDKSSEPLRNIASKKDVNNASKIHKSTPMPYNVSEQVGLNNSIRVIDGVEQSACQMLHNPSNRPEMYGHYAAVQARVKYRRDEVRMAQAMLRSSESAKESDTSNCDIQTETKGECNNNAGPPVITSRRADLLANNHIGNSILDKKSNVKVYGADVKDDSRRNKTGEKKYGNANSNHRTNETIIRDINVGFEEISYPMRRVSAVDSLNIQVTQLSDSYEESQIIPVDDDEDAISEQSTIVGENEGEKSGTNTMVDVEDQTTTSLHEISYNESQFASNKELNDVSPTGDLVDNYKPMANEENGADKFDFPDNISEMSTPCTSVLEEFVGRQVSSLMSSVYEHPHSPNDINHEKFGVETVNSVKTPPREPTSKQKRERLTTHLGTGVSLDEKSNQQKNEDKVFKQNIKEYVTNDRSSEISKKVCMYTKPIEVISELADHEEERLTTTVTTKSNESKDNVGCNSFIEQQKIHNSGNMLVNKPDYESIMSPKDVYGGNMKADLNKSSRTNEKVATFAKKEESIKNHIHQKKDDTFVADHNKRSCELLYKMYENNFMTDFTIETKQHHLQVHTSIICCQSSIFEKLIINGTKIARFPDIDTAIMKQIIAFMYTGDFIINKEDPVFNLLQIRKAGDNLSIKRLGIRCMDKLEILGGVAILNALVKSSDKLSENDKDAMMEILASNFSEIFDDPNAVKLSYTSLCKLLSYKKVDSLEMMKLKMIVNWINNVPNKLQYVHLLNCVRYSSLSRQEGLEVVNICEPLLYIQAVKDIIQVDQLFANEQENADSSVIVKDQEIKQTSSENCLVERLQEFNAKNLLTRYSRKSKEVEPTSRVGTTATTRRTMHRKQPERPTVVSLFVVGKIGTSTCAFSYNTLNKQWIRGFQDPLNNLRDYSMCSKEGEVYFSGGQYDDTKTGSTVVTNIVTTWSPVTHQWRMVGKMRCLRRYHCSIVVGDYLYIIGGFNSNNRKQCPTERINLKVKGSEFTVVSTLDVERAKFAVCEYDNGILICGGIGTLLRYRKPEEYIILNTVEYLDIRRLDHGNNNDIRSTPFPSMPTARHSHCVCFLDNRVYCMGGVGVSIKPLTCVEAFDRRPNAQCQPHLAKPRPLDSTSRQTVVQWWTSLADAPIAKRDFALLHQDNEIHIIGGVLADSSHSTSIESYDIAKDVWFKDGEVNIPRGMSRPMALFADV